MSNNFHLRARMFQSGRFVYTFMALIVPTATVISFNAVPILMEQFAPYDSISFAVMKTIVSFFTAAACIYSYFAFSCGIKKYFLGYIDSEKSKLSFLFHFFRPSNVIKTAKFAICFIFVKLLCFAVCFAPTAVMLFLFVRMVNNDSSLKVTAIFGCCLLLMFICSMYFYFKSKRLLFLCEYIFVEEPSQSFFACAKISTEKMANESGKLFRLRMSFAGWIMSCVVIFPIAYVWGYYQQAMAVAAEDFLMRNA
ncbi:MAG: hypothetical protein NC122_05155 [Faecalibacterium sp.]|nr:hypothetical protein [Ruminococcus sp.]MCM1391995.1 hypothetical protein [Ruminococcus sp.]MCM1485574.1 hypothetical protein [Faecalibacterium sp.]